MNSNRMYQLIGIVTICLLPMSYSLATESATNDPFVAIIQSIMDGNPISDTTSATQEIQKRLQWGQPSDRLLEESGRLAFVRGSWLKALTIFQKLNKPSPTALELLGECLDRKGERYEAATIKLKVARIYGPKNPKTISLLKYYISARPQDMDAWIDLAQAMSQQHREKEGAELLGQHTDEFANYEKSALVVGKVLESQQMWAAAATLYFNALHRNTKRDALSKRLLIVVKALPLTEEAAKYWQRLWDLSPSDTAITNKTLDAWEAVKDSSHFNSLLIQALGRDSSSPQLNMRAAHKAKEKGDRVAAWNYAEMAARHGESSSACLTLLSETIESDEDIVHYLPKFLAESRSDKATPAMLRVSARGLALQKK